MQRIATATKAVDLYGAGKHGFKDGNLALGISPTDLEAAWANGVQEELLNLIEAAGLVASGAVLSQATQAIAILMRQQTNTAFTTTGAAPNFVLTPTLAITAYTASLRYRVKFNVAGTGEDFINVSTLGNKSLKQYDATGAKVAAVIVAGQLADIEHDGVDFVILNPLQVANPSIQGASKNLQVSSTGLSANVSVTVDEIVVESTTNAYQTLRNVALTIAGTAVGPNGLDAGVLAGSTWYSVWTIWNGTTKAGLLSLSATAPAMPAGYTHKALVTWIRTDGTANKYPLPFRKSGRRTQYAPAAGSNLTSPLTAASGVSGTPGSSLSAVAMANFVPPSAVIVHVAIWQTGSGAAAVQVGPNSLATFLGGNGAALSGTASNNSQVTTSIVLESSNIYYASGSAGAGLLIYGWEDNL